MAELYVNPTQIEDGDLLDYLDGSLKVPEHMAYQKNIAELLFIDSVLDELFYESDCPDEEALLAYASGFLPRTEKKVIEQHLPDCNRCTEFVAQLKQLSERPDPLLTRIIQTGKRILAPWLEPAARQTSFALLGDDEKQYIYHAGEHQIMLTTIPQLPGTNLWQIEGHIINLHQQEMLYEGQVSILQEENFVINSDKLDEFGFFVLEEMTHGQYTLHIELENSIIPIPKFPIEI